MRRCVYTALTGGYEALNAQPVVAKSAMRFICFTDDPATACDGWEIRKLTPAFACDAIRSQRLYKMRPDAHLPEFDQSLYIDNSVLLKVPPEEIFAAADLTGGISLAAHSFRATVLDEFSQVLSHGLDDPARLSEQLRHYQESAPVWLTQRPFWSGLLLRDHRDAAVKAAMEIWVRHILRYSRRDQLSVGVALAQAGVRPKVLNLDNHQSPWHSWPHIESRKAERRLWQDGGAPRVGLLEVELARLRYEHDVLLRSSAWRMTGPLRRVKEASAAFLKKSSKKLL